MDDLLTVSEAATLAGVSVRTMRRRMAGGQVTAVGSGHDRRVLAASIPRTADTDGHGGQDNGCHPDTQADTTDSQAANGQADTATGREADRLAALVDRLSARLAEQAALTAMWQERAGTLGDRLAVAETQLLALAAPMPPDGPGASNLTPETPDPTTGGIRGLSWPTTRVVALVAVVAVLLAAGAWLAGS